MASGQVRTKQVRTKVELLGQDDFIPGKRGVSLSSDAAVAADALRDAVDRKQRPGLAVVSDLRFRHV